MKKTLLLFAVSCMAFGSLKAQFQRSYGTANREAIKGLQLTSDSGYIAAGYTNFNLAGNVDAKLFKTDFNGNLQWAKYYGRTGSDVFNSVKQVKVTGSNLTYVAAGSTQSYGQSEQAYLVGTDALGNSLFSKTYGGAGIERFNCIQRIVHPVSGPGYIMVGESNTYTVFGAGYDIFVVHTDLMGNTIKSAVVGSTGDQRGYWIEQTADRGFIIAGSTTKNCGNVTALNQNIFTVKLDANLNLLWDRVIGHPTVAADDIAYCVKEDNTGSLVYTGSTRSFGTNGDAFLLKLSPAGGFMWLKTYIGAKTDQGNALLVDKNANGVRYVVSGTTNSFTTSGIQDAFVFKTDANGNQMSLKTFGQEAGTEQAYEIVFNSNNANLIRGYAFAGITTSFGAGSGESYLTEMNNALISTSNCEKYLHTGTTIQQPCITIDAKVVVIQGFQNVPNDFTPLQLIVNKCSIPVISPADARESEDIAAPLAAEKVIRLAPNPANSEVSLFASESFAGGTLKIMNTSGSVVKEMTVENSNIQISVEELPAGIYFVNLYGADGSVVTEKLIKN